VPDSANEPVYYALRAKVGSSDRLSIPLPLLRMMDWWTAVPTTVLGELVEPGLMRLCGLADAEPILADITQAARNGDEDRHDRWMAFRDKFRLLSLYKDGRLLLTQETLWLFDLPPKEPWYVYVQAAGRTIEVMSEKFRLARLERHRHLTLGLHLVRPPDA